MIIVRNRELVVPQNERFIGTSYDTNSDVRQIQIDRIGVNGIDLSNLHFYLDILREDGSKDTFILEKEIHDEYIVLSWEITEPHTRVPGTLFVNIRAKDDRASVRWGSNRAAFYVEGAIDTPSAHAQNLGVFEQMENKINAKMSKIEGLERKVEQNHAESLKEIQRKTQETKKEAQVQIDLALNELKADIAAQAERLNAASEDVKQQGLQAIADATRRIDELEQSANLRLNNAEVQLNNIFMQKSDALEKAAMIQIAKANDDIALAKQELLSKAEELKQSLSEMAQREIQNQSNNIQSQVQGAIEENKEELKRQRDAFASDITNLTNSARNAEQVARENNVYMNQFLEDYNRKLASGELKGEKGDKGENGDAAIATDKKAGIVKGGSDVHIEKTGEIKIKTDFEYTDLGDNIALTKGSPLSHFLNILANVVNFLTKLKNMIRPATATEPGMIALGEDFTSTEQGHLKIKDSAIASYLERNPIPIPKEKSQYEFDLTDAQSYPLEEYTVRALCTPNMDPEGFYIDIPLLKPGLHYVRVKEKDDVIVGEPGHMNFPIDQYRNQWNGLIDVGDVLLIETKLYKVANRPIPPRYEEDEQAGLIGDNYHVVQFMRFLKKGQEHFTPDVSKSGYHVNKQSQSSSIFMRESFRIRLRDEEDAYFAHAMTPWRGIEAVYQNGY